MAHPKIQLGIETSFFFIMYACVLSNNNNDDGFNEKATYLLKLREALYNLPSNWFDNNTTMCQWTPAANFHHVEKIKLGSRGLNKSLVTLLYLVPFRVSPSSKVCTYIPHGCFQGLESLELLDLSYNTNLPPWTFSTDLNSYSRLPILRLSATNLMGSLPDKFDSFPVLMLIHLSENHLIGVLPESFLKLPRLSRSDLSDQTDNNKLLGTIQVLSSMPQLYEVNLGGNSFEGSIPDLSDCTRLQHLFLANNRLTSVVPPYWLQDPISSFNKTRTPKVNLTANAFCLDHPGPCDHRVTTLLQVAQVFHYPFLLAQSWRRYNPYQAWNFITYDDKANIRSVNLTNMNLAGTISPSFESLTDLYGLYLSGNKLNGSIPQSLTSLRQLTGCVQ